MSEDEVIERAHKNEEEGKSPSTQAGEFVREEMHHIREGKHGARSPQQAIAIGLSKARRAGVDLKAPKSGKATSRVRKQAQRDLKRGEIFEPSASVQGALQSNFQCAETRRTFCGFARKPVSTGTQGCAEARKAVKSKGSVGLRAAGRKAARTRASHRLA